MSTAGTSLTPGAADDPLVRSVARLRAERDGLRRAMQSRSVIEQAKGVLMATHLITADQAFGRLLEASQRSNVKLAEVAAGVVAGVSPVPGTGPVSLAEAGDPLSGGRRSLLGGSGARNGGSGARNAESGVRNGGGPGRQPSVRRPPAGSGEDSLAQEDLDAVHTRHLLTVARLQAAESYDEIVAALAGTLPAPLSAVLLLCEADRALRLVAHRGIAPEAASQWGRIPPQVQLPLTDAVRTGAPVWVPDREALAISYPTMAAISARSGSVAAIPLVVSGRVVGTVGLTWPSPGLGGEHNRPFLAALGEVCGAATGRIATSAGLPGTENAWLRPLIEGALDCAVVLSPVREDGRITDFTVEYINERAAGMLAVPGPEAGRAPLACEAFGSGAAELLPLWRDVLSDGWPRQRDDLFLPGAGPGVPGSTVAMRAVRLGERVVTSWRCRSTGELLYDDLVAADRSAGVAAFRWWPRTGQWLASPVLAELLSSAGAPLTPLTAYRAVDEDHRPAVRRAAVLALRGGRPPAIGVAARGRWLRLTLAPADGGLSGAVQDITELRSVLARRPSLAPSRP